MKFADLRPGEEFEFAGKPYRKSGPLTASPMDEGGSVVIPRSASVTPVSAGARPANDAPKPVPAEQVARAIEELFRLGLQTAERHGDDSAAAELASLRQHCLERCGLQP